MRSRSCPIIEAIQNVDERGSLDLYCLDDKAPFKVSRVFIISNVPEGVTRGGHAHRSVDELLVVVKGRVRVDLRVGQEARTVFLEGSRQGLYLPPMVWASQTFYDDAVMIVLASGDYNVEDHINDFACLSGNLGDIEACVQ